LTYIGKYAPQLYIKLKGISATRYNNEPMLVKYKACRAVRLAPNNEEPIVDNTRQNIRNISRAKALGVANSCSAMVSADERRRLDVRKRAPRKAPSNSRARV
jgi:hypothetical protein